MEVALALAAAAALVSTQVTTLALRFAAVSAFCMAGASAYGFFCLYVAQQLPDVAETIMVQPLGELRAFVLLARSVVRRVLQARAAKWDAEEFRRDALLYLLASFLIFVLTLLIWLSTDIVAEISALG